VRPLQIRVALGTSTGWNVRAPDHRASNLCGLSGAYFPFAKTEVERRATGDPRKSIEERYTDRTGFVDAVTKAANELVTERFLLREDAEAFIRAAETSELFEK